MRLCFGTFATVLNCCRSSNILQAPFITKLMLIVDPKKKYIGDTIVKNNQGEDEIVGDGPIAHKLLHCKMNFVFSDREAAVLPTKDSVINNFATEISPYVDENKKAKIILTLLKIIQKDAYIDSEKRESFKKYLSIDKSQLLLKSEFIFSDFLGKIFLYTVCSNINNKVGAKCVKEITNEYIESITQPYTNDYQWNSSTETLILTYVKMFEFLNKAMHERRIFIFIEKIDPTIQMDIRWIDVCDDFLRYINDNILSQFISNSVESSGNMFQKILKLAQILDEYTTYLGYNMRPISPNRDIMVPIYRDENMQWYRPFIEKTNEYRQKFCTIYQEICHHATLYTESV